MQPSTAQIALFASPAIPIAALGLPLLVYLPPFYADDVGLGLTVVGTVFMVTRFWDVITDAFMGVLSDRVRTRFGRRRPVMVLAVPIVVACVLTLFFPPEGAGVEYLLVGLLALYVGWTLLTISHMAWAAELSTDYHTRTRIQAWRELALIAGMMLVLTLPAVLEQRLGGGGATRVAAMGAFVAVLLPLTVALAVWRVPEPAVAPEKRPALGWAAVRVAAANPAMVRVLAADLLAGLGPGVTAALYVFFVEHAMQMGRWTSTFLVAYFAAALVSVPIWLRVSYRVGKHRAFCAAMLYGACVLPLVLFLGPEDVAIYAVANVVYGLAYGAAPVLLRSITADVTDDDEVSSGAQRSGLFYSLLALTHKLGLALSVGLSYLLLDAVGFDPDAGSSAPGAIAGLKAIYVAVPVVCFLGAAAALWRFPLDQRRQAELREAIARGRGG